MKNAFDLPEDEASRQLRIAYRRQLRDEVRWLASGLAGASVAFIIAIFALQQHDLTFAACSFATALPLLAGALIFERYLPHFQAAQWLLNFGAGGVIIGIGMILAHITLLALIGYVLACGITGSVLLMKRFGQVSAEFKWGFLADYYSDGPRALKYDKNAQDG